MTVKAQVRSYPALQGQVEKVDILVMEKGVSVYWEMRALKMTPLTPNERVPDEIWSQIPEDVARAMYLALQQYYDRAASDFGVRARAMTVPYNPPDLPPFAPGKFLPMPDTNTDREDYLQERDRVDKLIDSLTTMVKYWTENT